MPLWLMDKSPRLSQRMRQLFPTKLVYVNVKNGSRPHTLEIKLTTNQCKVLSSAGTSHVLYAGDEQYLNRTKSYWSVSSQLTPNCIVQPRSTDDVSTVVKTLVEHASCKNTQFAVRSGGHMIWGGSNNIKNGITVDLGLMNSTKLDLETNVAAIQPGSRWGQVYATLDPLGFTVAGGRAASVGVAGFLTGGGNSFYSAHQGFACDTVTNFEVVLASG
jgi:FAD/FMN-containing dehydrogenase